MCFCAIQSLLLLPPLSLLLLPSRLLPPPPALHFPHGAAARQPAGPLARTHRPPPHARSSLPPTRPLQIGFFALLLVELVAGKGLLELLNVTVGQGLGFEF